MHNILLYLFIVLSLGLTAQNSNLNYDKIIDNGKEYYLYQVKESEGFMAIGRKFGIAYQDIIEANKEQIAQGLKVGQLIRIPILNGRNANNLEIKSDNFVYHKVAAGETLFFISRLYGVSINDIVENNPNTNKSLKLGQELKIPKKDTATPNQKPKTEVDKNYLYHTILPKETAYGISKKYSISIADIAAANPGLQTNNLKLGMTIRIPKNAQNLNNNAKLSDASYTYHRVKIGETLESIAQQYDITTNIIINSNNLSQTLPPVGYLLKIPHSYEYIVETENQYTVKKNDDISNIAEQHQIPITNIKEANPDVKKWSKLKKGTVITIPTLKVDTMSLSVNKEKVLTDIKNYFNGEIKSLGDTINVAFLWPLFLERNDTINDIKTIDPITQVVSYSKRHVKTIYPSNTVMFREFYYGALMALRELKELGIDINIRHYDTEKSAVSIIKTLESPDIKSADIIFGPAFHNHINAVSDYCLNNHIRLVVPYISNNKNIANNPYTFQIFPSPEIEYNYIAKNIAKRHANANFIVVKSLKGDNRQTLFTEYLKTELYKPDSSIHHQVSYKEMNFNRDQIGGITALLSPEKENLIIIPDEKEKNYTRVIPILKNYCSRHKNIKIKLLGFSEYQFFELSELESLYNVGCELYTPLYADIFSEEPRMQNFMSYYSQYFNDIPTHTYPYYSLLGYDVVSYFISGLGRYGNKFEMNIDKIKYDGLCVDFDFKRINNWGGFINRSMYTLEYTKDFDTILIEE